MTSVFLSKVPSRIVMEVAKDKLEVPGPGAYFEEKDEEDSLSQKSHKS